MPYYTPLPVDPSCSTPEQMHTEEANSMIILSLHLGMPKPESKEIGIPMEHIKGGIVENKATNRTKEEIEIDLLRALFVGYLAGYQYSNAVNWDTVEGIHSFEDAVQAAKNNNWKDDVIAIQMPEVDMENETMTVTDNYMILKLFNL